MPGVDERVLQDVAEELPISGRVLAVQDHVRGADHHLRLAAVLHAQLPGDGLDDFVIDASQPVDVVAQQVAERLGW